MPTPQPGPSVHVWSYYGLRSQVWLYRLLRHLERYPAHLLVRRAWLQDRPVEEFPWPEDRRHFLPERSAAVRLVSKLGPWLRTGNRHVLGALDARWVRHVIQRLGARVLHVHFGWLAVPWLEACPDWGVPVVVSLYGSDVFRASGRYQRRLAKLLRARPSAVVVTSTALREQVLKWDLPPKHVYVVPVGLDLDAFPPPEELMQHRRERAGRVPVRLITVGRMVPCKAHHRLPDIARLLVDRGLKFVWTVVGDGPERPALEKRAQVLGIRERFDLPGELPYVATLQRLRESDLMVHNAMVAPDGEREALGVVLMEAAAMGLPVVSCRVGGIPEVVVEGKTGFLVPEGDLPMLAERVLRLARDPSLRIEMGIQAIRHARTAFDSRLLAHRLEAVYDFVSAQC